MRSALIVLLAVAGCKREPVAATPPSGTPTSPSSKAEGPSAGGEKIQVPGAPPRGDEGGVNPGSLTLAPPSGDNPPDSSYAVEVVPAQGAVGKATAAKIKVSPGSGYKMNLEYNSTIAFGEGAVGVTIGTPDKKLSEKELEIEIPLTPSATGPHTVAAQLKFAVCTATTCIPKKHKVSLALTAE